MKKSRKRTAMLECLMDHLSSEQLLAHIDYRSKKESLLKSSMESHLRDAVNEIYEEQLGYSRQSAAKRTADSIILERDTKRTIHNTRFLGAQHRPDFKLVLDKSIVVAVEIKKGESGQSVREGIGQALVYTASGEYHFAIFLLADTSIDGKLQQSLTGNVAEAREIPFVESLWSNYNVMFRVIGDFKKRR